MGKNLGIRDVSYVKTTFDRFKKLHAIVKDRGRINRIIINNRILQ